MFPLFSNVSVFKLLRFRRILNRSHDSVFIAFIAFAQTIPLLRFLAPNQLLLLLLLKRFRMTQFSGFPMKTMPFQISLLSDHFTVSSVFRCMKRTAKTETFPTVIIRKRSNGNGIWGEIEGVWAFLVQFMDDRPITSFIEGPMQLAYLSLASFCWQPFSWTVKTTTRKRPQKDVFTKHARRRAPFKAT